MKRKAFAALTAVCLALCLILAGCGTVSEEDYPPLEKVDLSSMTLGTVSNSTFSTQYPADKWTGSDGTSPLIIYYNDTQGTGQAVNINAQQSGTYSGKFTEKYMNKLTESITESFPNIEILNAELRSINGKSVIYTETVTRFNDELLDRLLEQGVITQDDVDAAGGRDLRGGQAEQRQNAEHRREVAGELAEAAADDLGDRDSHGLADLGCEVGQRDHSKGRRQDVPDRADAPRAEGLLGQARGAAATDVVGGQGERDHEQAHSAACNEIVSAALDVDLADDVADDHHADHVRKDNDQCTSLNFHIVPP